MGDRFNENLKAAREALGLSQKEVAERVGVANSTYSLYENGKREPNVQTIKKIANVLNVSADRLLGLSEDIETIAAHFDGDGFTPEEMKEIENYAQYVKMRGKSND